MVIILDFGSFKNLKAHTGKHINHLILHCSQGMQIAHGTYLYGNSYINCFLFILFLKLKCLNLSLLLVILFLNPYFYIIDKLAVFLLLFLGHLFNFTH